MKDWLPTNDLKLAKLIGVWDVKLSSTANRTAFAWDSTDCANTQANMAKFTDALEKYQHDPTRSKRIDKDEAKEIAKTAMRLFAGDRIRKNPRMSVVQKLEMGVGPRDETKTSGGKVKDTLDMSFRNDPHANTHIQYTDYKKHDADNKSKDPYQLAVFQIYIQGPGDPPPRVDSDEFWSRDIINLSSPLKIIFKGDDAGKMCWYRARWQARNAKQGDWSMASALIP
jgi:hypothetical protein